MRDFLFNLPPGGAGSLQSRIRRMVIGAILDGQLPEDSPLPSCRALARRLGVARNTVVLAYQGLVDEGYVVARERSGFYVDGDIRVETPRGATVRAGPGGPTVDWGGRFAVRPSGHRNIAKPLDWQRYPYPFIYGEVDPGLFPLTAWRECSRQALSRSAVKDWSHDQFAADDPMLVEEIRARVLPRRGVRAAAAEILVTLGAQHALYLLATLLIGDATTVGLEEPGYVDARNICRLRGARIKPLAVDADGLVVDRSLDACDYVYVTPSHQSPTTVTMPLERRAALLERAAAKGVVVIEDDYEPEANYVSDPTTALKSLDDEGRVIHIGSFSKALAPGLRLGYMVADPVLIAEARALRRPMLRHPPSNNQRTVALFLRDGHYDAHVHRLHRTYRARWAALGDALARYLPASSRVPSFGGTSFWVEGPAGLDAGRLARAARDEGIVIEPGAVHFLAKPPPRNFFRLGFSAIPTERIEPGIELLADLIARETG